MTPASALAVAVAGSGSYGCATVLQAVSARSATAAGALDPRLALRLLRSLPYLLGIALDVAGFAATVAALRTLPLFTVQAIIAGSVGVTAIVAKATLGLPLSRRTVVALIALVGGLAGLCVAAKPGPATALNFRGSVALLATTPALAAVAMTAARRRSRIGDVTLSAVAGAAFGAVSIAARGLKVPHPVWHLATTPAALAIASFGALAVVTLPIALQRSSVTSTAAVMLVVETVVPAAVGLAVLGDSTRGPAGSFIALLGFVVTLGATLMLAGFTTVPDGQHQTSPPDGTAAALQDDLA